MMVCSKLNDLLWSTRLNASDSMHIFPPLILFQITNVYYRAQNSDLEPTAQLQSHGRPMYKSPYSGLKGTNEHPREVYL